MPFSEAAAAYIEEHVSSLSVDSIRFYQSIVRVLNEEFGASYLDEITRKRLTSFEVAQAKRVSASRLKHYRAAMSGLFRIALRHEWVDANPCKLLDPIQINNERERFLTANEWDQLKKALTEPYRSIAEISILRGMRCGEILAMKWVDVDQHRDLITIPKGKGGKRRVIPLEEAALVLDRQPQTGNLVFPGRTGRPMRVDAVSRNVNSAAKGCGIRDFTFHDLRHTFASWYVQNGGDMYPLQIILGHKGPAMTQRYTHLRVDDLRNFRTKTGTLH